MSVTNIDEQQSSQVVPFVVSKLISQAMSLCQQPLAHVGNDISKIHSLVVSTFILI